jgi:SAM-dependent methyltransferase
MPTEFDRYASSYEDLVRAAAGWSGGTVREFAEHKAGVLDRHFDPASILDFGCGVGVLTAALRQTFPGAEVDGYDPSPKSVEACLARVGGRFTTELGELGTGYDLIVISNVLHHVAPSFRPRLMSAVREHLAPGGALAVFEHNPINPATRLVVSRCEFDHDAILVEPAECRALVEGAGMQHDATHYVLFFPPKLRWLWRWERHLGKLPLGAQYLVIGRNA